MCSHSLRRVQLRLILSKWLDMVLIMDWSGCKGREVVIKKYEKRSLEWRRIDGLGQSTRGESFQL